MTTAQNLLYAFFLASVVLLSNFRTPAQNKRPLPGDLNQDSSVSEILTWLDQTTFRNMRMVLKDSSDAFTYSPPWDDSHGVAALSQNAKGGRRVVKRCERSV